MTGPDTTNAPESPPVPNSSSNSWKSTLWLIIGSVTAVLAVQTWSGASVLNRTADLRAVLSQAHDTASELERRIGYGGLIHNFKNYVLRPEEDNYRVSAIADATQALALLERLQLSAMAIGIDAPLDNTHEMLESYARGLGQVQELSVKGLSSRAIDEQVRFDDEPALLEVGFLLEKLDSAIDDRLGELNRQGAVTSLLSTASTAALGLLLIGIVARRHERHTRALSAFTEHLTASNEKLTLANTSLRQFAGIVSHDLKTPVRYIHTFNSMIVEDSADTQAVEQHVDQIDQQVQQMNRIIDSLLDFTKFGFTRPALEKIAIRRLFSDIEYALQSDVEKQCAVIQFKTDLNTQVLADPTQVTRLFLDIIGNSLKYVCNNIPARILVCAETEDEEVRFSVTDNGIGIEPRFATNIFEPMTRLHGPQSQYKGVGIGLSLAKTIVESHGGQIWLDTAFSKGTRIVFSLPLAQAVELKKIA